MDIKEAVAAAKSHAIALFQGEKVQDLGLEEVEFDEENREWQVTLGFSRPWDREPITLPGSLAEALAPSPRPLRRDLKVVRVRDEDGSVVALKNHA